MVGASQRIERVKHRGDSCSVSSESVLPAAVLTPPIGPPPMSKDPQISESLWV